MKKNFKPFYKSTPIDFNLKNKIDPHIKPIMNKAFNLGNIFKSRQQSLDSKTSRLQSRNWNSPVQRSSTFRKAHHILLQRK